LATVKRGLRGLFSLLPEASCAALYRSLRWPLGRCCVYCGGTNLRTKDPHYRLHWQQQECLDCSAKRGREVTFTDLSGTILEGSHLPCPLWMWGAFLFVFGCSTQELAQELQVNYKTARRMVFLFQLSYLMRASTTARGSTLVVRSIATPLRASGHCFAPIWPYIGACRRSTCRSTWPDSSSCTIAASRIVGGRW